MVAPALPQQVPQMPGMMAMGAQGLPPSNIIDADFQMLVSHEESNIGPQKPAWYVPLPKPTARQIMDEANDHKEQHMQRVLDQARMEMRVGMEVSAIFNADAMWVALKEIEPQSSMLLRRMFDTIVDFVANQTVQHTSLAHGMVNREERVAIEDHLDDSHHDWEASHFREGQGDLLRTLTADALSGLVAVYHAPDPGNERTGQRKYRVDPKCVFPVFGRDGVECVYVVYEATFPQVMRDYADGVDDETGKANPATAAIQKVARKGMGSGNTRIDTETCYELIGYWDRTRAIITWKGETIREWDHNLWVCPWHIGVPNWRNRGGVKASGGYGGDSNRPGPLVDVDGVSRPYEGFAGSGSRGRDASRMYEPFLTPWVSVADLFEQLITRYKYAADRSLQEPLAWKRSGANSEDGAPELQNFRNGVTEIQEDEELDYLPRNPLNDAFGPLWELLQVEMQMAIPSTLMQGQNIGTQASGNALDTINAMGLSMLSAVPAFMQRFLGEIDHRDLTYIRDWNPTYQSPGGPGLAVPRRSTDRYSADPTRLTDEMLKRAGCYVEVTLNRFNLAGMAATATTMAVLDAQVHIGDRRFWAQQAGFPNPERIVDERRQQDLEDTPGFAEGRAIEYLYDEMERAAALSDDKSLRRVGSFAKRVAAKQTMHDLALAKMSGMLPPQPEPMPGELPANTGQPGGNPMPYLSAPEVGGATGTEGGAPTQQPPLPGMG